MTSERGVADRTKVPRPLDKQSVLRIRSERIEFELEGPTREDLHQQTLDTMRRFAARPFGQWEVGVTYSQRYTAKDSSGQLRTVVWTASVVAIDREIRPVVYEISPGDISGTDSVDPDGEIETA